MKKNIIGLAVVSTVVLMSGCAQKATSIKATYASPIKYENSSCAQLGNEMNRVNQRAKLIAGEQDSTATKDAVVMAVGLVVFAPALFFLAQGDDQEAEIGRLKGEYNAVRDVAIKKNCKWVQNFPQQ